MRQDHVIAIVVVFALALPARAGSLNLPGSFTAAQFASFGMAAADVALSATGSTTTWAAGVGLNVPVLCLVGEVRHAANLAFFLGAGVGL